MTQPWSAQKRCSARIRPWNERSGRIWAGRSSAMRDPGAGARVRRNGAPAGGQGKRRPSPHAMRHARLPQNTSRTSGGLRAVTPCQIRCRLSCCSPRPRPPCRRRTCPNKPIHVVIAFPAGGPTDFVGRLVADKVKDILGRTIIIENKAGANGAIGADYVAKSEPDGTTLFLTTIGAVGDHAAHAQRPALRFDPGLRAGHARGAEHHDARGASRTRPSSR